jgi:hypothetical protein
MPRKAVVALLILAVIVIIGIFITYSIFSSSGSSQPVNQPSVQQPTTQQSTTQLNQQPPLGTLTPPVGTTTMPAITPQPSPYTSRVCEYSFTPQIMSEGGNIPLGTVAWTNLADMKQKCSQTPLCLAFDSMGYFKSSIVSDLTKDGVKVAYWTPEQGTWKQTTCK